MEKARNIGSQTLRAGSLKLAMNEQEKPRTARDKTNSHEVMDLF